MKASISNEPCKDIKSARKPRAKVYIVISERDGWDESIVGIYFDEDRANRHKYKIKRRLERLKWDKDDFNVFVRPWDVDG